MKCDKYNRLICLHLDGRLGESEERELREHVSRCARCAKTLTALQSAEKSLRAAKAAEPDERYWDTFSRRVAERIDAREAARERTGLGRLAAVLFPTGSRGLRIAAGVASLVIVIAVGVIFVEHQREGVVPPGLQAPVGKEASEKRAAEAQPEGFSETAAETPLEAPAESQRAAGTKEEIADAHSEATKTQTEPGPAPRAGKPTQKAVEPATRASEPTSEGVDAAPSLRDQEKEAIAERQPEAQNALGESAAADQVKERQQHLLERTRDTREIPSATESARSKVETFSVVEKDTQPRGAVLHGLSEGARVRGLADKDSSITDEDLRRVIATWKTHFEAHPADTLNALGYREVAQAYVLLARRTRDETIIAEGSDVIRTYLGRTEDSELRSFLAARLHEIETLKKK